MRNVNLKSAKGRSRRAMFMAWAVVLVHGTARSALPSPVEVGSSPSAVATVPQPVSSPIETGESSDESWSLPPVRLGGNISYSLSRRSADVEDSTSSSLNGTLNAETRTYIWRPWFATLNANLGFTKLTDHSEVNGSASSTSSVAVTGNGRLSVLEQSRFPFEAYFERADNRVSNDLTVANGYASQRFGFTQRHARQDGSEMFGWNRSTQSSNENGEDLQDSLVLQISHNLGSHIFQLSGDRSISLHELTGENAVQEALTLQHNYSAGSEITMVNLANVNRSELNLVQGETKNRLLQLSSNVFWRPEEQSMTVSGGARFYSLRGDSDIGFGDPLGTQTSSANVYAGVNYEYNRFIRANANFSANTFETNGSNVSQTSQSAGVSYRPDDIDLGFVKYNWGTSASANVQRSGDQSESGLNLQISHRLSQSYKLEGGSTISVDGSQGLSASSINRTSDSTVVTDLLPLTPTRQLTHGASISWDQYDQSGSEQVRLSFSDSRALDGPQDYFQLLNFQVSNSRPISGYSYWAGSLTIQMMLQGNKGLYSNAASSSEGVSTSANGSISYQNQRLFGLRNLRFGSDLRLNIQSSQRSQQSQQTQFLPQSPFTLLESRNSQEVAAWSNRIDYSIGRTRVRLNATISQNTVGSNDLASSTIAATRDPEKRTNRSINLTISRSFGSY